VTTRSDDNAADNTATTHSDGNTEKGSIEAVKNHEDEEEISV